MQNDELDNLEPANNQAQEDALQGEDPVPDNSDSDHDVVCAEDDREFSEYSFD